MVARSKVNGKPLRFDVEKKDWVKEDNPIYDYTSKRFKDIVKKIMQFCPYDLAKDVADVEETVKNWIKSENELWDGCLETCWQTGGFVFKRAKSGRRYIEVVPSRIYFD